LWRHFCCQSISGTMSSTTDPQQMCFHLCSPMPVRKRLLSKCKPPCWTSSTAKCGEKLKHYWHHTVKSTYYYMKNFCLRQCSAHETLVSVTHSRSLSIPYPVHSASCTWQHRLAGWNSAAGLILTPIWFITFYSPTRPILPMMESTIRDTPINGIMIIHMDLLKATTNIIFL